MTNGDDDETEQTITRRPSTPVPRTQARAHFLTFSDGGIRRRVVIGAPGLTIGRAGDVSIQAPDISRRHCRIDLDAEWATITDLNSTNGTFVDGEQVRLPTRLTDGAGLSLGSFPLRYERRDPRDVAREEELAADLRRAEDYVRAILPRPIPDGPVHADWWFEPSSQLGGDAFGYQFLDDATFAGFVLDVSGHGIGAAMHAVNVANVLRRRTLPGVDFRDPAQVAAGLNAAFPMEEHNDLMLTLWYFVYDLTTRSLRFCSGGHHASFLVTPAVDQPVALLAKGGAIGMLPTGRWTEATTPIPPGSCLYVFSDGAFEIVTADGGEWGIEDLRRIIAEPDTTDPSRVWHRVQAAARPGPLDDDFSVLAITFP